MLKKSKDGKVAFSPKKHVYKIGKKVLTSGTQFLKPYFQPFNAKEIARKLAKFPVNKKAKRGVRYWLAEWKAAAQHGTDVHTLMENFFYFMTESDVDCVEEAPKYEQRTHSKHQKGADWLVNYWDSVNPLGAEGVPEYIVYNEELGIAGQIDLLVTRLDIQTGEEVVDLIDWKTNKRIDSKNYDGLPCFEPLDNFESTTFLKYQLQLSLYAYLLELKGKKVGRLILVHLTEDGAKEIDMDYRPDLIELLLDYEANKNDKDNE